MSSSPATNDSCDSHVSIYPCNETYFCSFDDFVKDGINLLQNTCFLYFNIWSLKAKNRLDNLQLIIDSLQGIDLLLFTESWLSNANQKYYNFPGYVQLAVNRPVGRGGGVAAFIKKSCSHNIIDSISTQTHSILYISVGCPIKYHVVLFYNPDLKNLSKFLIDLEVILQKVPSRNVLVFGDSNFNLLGTPEIISDYISVMNSYGLYLMNSKFPTRETDNSSTLIDHIFCSAMDRFLDPSVSTISHDLSDHNALLLSFHSNHTLSPESSKKVISVPDYKKIQRYLNLNPFSSDLRDVDVLTTDFREFLANVVSDCSRTIVIEEVKYRQPWVTTEFRNLCKRRNYIFKQKKKNLIIT